MSSASLRRYEVSTAEQNWVVAYVRGLMSGRAQHFLGRSQTGSAIVIMLLLGLLTIVGSGPWL